MDADDVDALAVQLRIHALVAEYQSSQGRWQTAQGVALGAGAFGVVGYLGKTVAADSAAPILVLSAVFTGLASLALRRSQRRFNREVSHHLKHLERLKTPEAP